MNLEELNEAHAAAMAEVAKLNEGGIAIHGKRYTTVAKRIEVFRKHFGVHGRTRVVESTINEEGAWMKAVAELSTDGKDWFTVAEGHAEEKRTASAINRTSAVENCETSAFGRALANFGLHGGEYASANEVEHAKVKQAEQPTHMAHEPTKLDGPELNPAKRDTYLPEIVRYIEADDSLGLKQLIDELTPNEQAGIWRLLNSKQKAKARELMQKKAAA